MTGTYHVNLPERNATNNRIVSWTMAQNLEVNRDDRIVKVTFNVGGYIEFSNIPATWISGSRDITQTTWDPPGDEPRPTYTSHATYFDNRPLSSRDSGYRQIAVNFFADFVLSNYLVTRYYDVEPTIEIMEILEGRVPDSPKDVATLICANPELLRNIKVQESPFEASNLSSGARQAIAALLENADSLELYLQAPEEILNSTKDEVTENERVAFIRAAKEKPDLVRRGFDSVELGRAKGDGNTYVLLGINPETNMPDRNSLDWFLSQMNEFEGVNGFTPAFGYFVTDANSRFHIVLGPNVTDREADYLKLFGHNIIDRREGGRIGRIYPDFTLPTDPDFPGSITPQP